MCPRSQRQVMAIMFGRGQPHTWKLLGSPDKSNEVKLHKNLAVTWAAKQNSKSSISECKDVVTCPWSQLSTCS